MTQQEILNLDNLKTAELKPGMFLHIHSNEGYVITNYKEGDDIKTYSSSVCYYMPIKDEYNETYRIITVEENKRLIELRDKAKYEDRTKKMSEIKNNTVTQGKNSNE